MRSASSSTTTSTAEIEDVLLVVVDQAAGGADQDIDPGGQVVALLLVAGAAEHQADPKPVWRPSSRVSLWICTASSRVGASTSARGWDWRAAGGRLGEQVLEHASRKAAVLPVPVCACPATS